MVDNVGFLTQSPMMNSEFMLIFHWKKGQYSPLLHAAEGIAP
jgi:hypothetical protein